MASIADVFMSSCETATNPSIDLILLIRRRRLRYLGHILRMDSNRLIRRTLYAYVHGGFAVPEGSLLDDCDGMSLDELAVLALDRCGWKQKVDSLY